MCKAVSLLEDSKSVNAFLNLIKTWMKDSTSLVALSLTSGRVIGVAVIRVNSDSDKSDTFNRVLVCMLLSKIKWSQLEYQTSRPFKYTLRNFITIFRHEKDRLTQDRNYQEFRKFVNIILLVLKLKLYI